MTPLQLNKALTSQIVDRYSAQKAIFAALRKGRRISLLDSHEFNVSEMHTQICCIRKNIREKNMPYELKSEWIFVGEGKRRIKEYWLEATRTLDTL